jgi:hypothetical protein
LPALAAIFAESTTHGFSGSTSARSASAPARSSPASTRAARRVARDEVEGALEPIDAVAHQRQDHRQQRLGPGHARRGVGERQALVSGPRGS